MTGPEYAARLGELQTELRTRVASFAETGSVSGIREGLGAVGERSGGLRPNFVGKRSSGG